MKVRSWATLTTDLPDDAVEEDGRFVDFGGRNVVAVIEEILKGFGYRIEDVEDLAEKGWHLHARSSDLTIWCRLTSMHPEIILGIDETMKGFQTSYPELMSRFHQALVADGRFRDIVWRTSAEMDRGDPGSPIPVTDEAERDEGRAGGSSKPWWKRMLGLN